MIIDSRGRPRAPLRILFFIVFTTAFLVAAELVGRALVGDGETERLSPARLLPGGLLRFLPVLAATWLAVKVADRRPLASVGFPAGRPAGRQMLLGLAAGAAGPLAYAAVLSATGNLRLSLAPELSIAALAASALGFVLAAGFEELLLRGYLLQTLAAPLGPAPAVLITGVLFGLLHGSNPNVDAFGTWLIVVVGVLLAWLAVRTASLWAVCAFHTAWNITGSLVLGLTLSGIAPGASVLVADVEGPERLTGGAFGFESSVVTLIALVVVLGLVVAVSGPRLRHEELARYYRRAWARDDAPAVLPGARDLA
jgi:membrane protease YdiL (CAAX protease family)